MLQALSQLGKIKENNQIWIPYYQAVADLLPATKGTDNRFTKRLFSFLKIITLSNAHLRYKLRIKDTNEELVIANLEHDLEQALRMVYNLKGTPLTS
jgi:hypothetical protein